MKFAEALHLIFKYKTFDSDTEKPQEKLVLDDVSLTINQGEFVAILGHNGSGKSTLARQLTALLQPTHGAVYLKGMDTADAKNLIPIRKTAGMVFQNPDNQLIGNVVEEDVAFGPENLGVPTEEIWDRVTEALEATGMSAYRMEVPGNLSGGQKQRIAISGILAMEPECIVLDEPTAMLDPVGRKEVLQAIRRLNREKKITIIYITHHVEEVKDADRLYLMEKGRLILQGTPQEFWNRADLLQQQKMELPFDQKLMVSIREKGMKIPFGTKNENELLAWLQRKQRGNHLDRPAEKMEKNLTAKEKSCSDTEENVGLTLSHVSYQYGNNGQEEGAFAVKDINLTLTRGEYVAIIGKTGSGKSTLLQLMNGLLKPQEGICFFDGENVHEGGYPIQRLRQKVALCFQYPEYQLFEETVLKDIMFGPKNLGLDEKSCKERARTAMELTGLSKDLEEESPFALSGGQKRRVALAGILAMEPEYLILDEPAAGLDQEGKNMLFALLRRLNEEKSITVILVSHDMDEVASQAKRVIVMNDGVIVVDDNKENVFRNAENLQETGLELPRTLQFYRALYGEDHYKKAKHLPMTVEELAKEIADNWEERES